MNSFAPFDPSLLDVVLPPDEQGYPEHEMLADREPGVLFGACGSTSRRMPDKLRVPEREWAKMAAENDQHHTWPINYIDRFTNQQPTHECTCHSWTRGFECARNRQRAVKYIDGPKKGYRYQESEKVGSVWMSPLSLYGQVNPPTWRNPQQRGGAGVRQVLEVSVRNGVLPDKIQPRDYGFKHTLHGTAGKGNSNQSSGGPAGTDDFPQGWEETAKLFRPEEVIFPESFEDAVSLILHGYAVCVGRDGHAIPWCFLTFTGNRLTAAGYPDSYDVIRYDSVRTMRFAWQGAFAIASVVTPDDWNNPAS